MRVYFGAAITRYRKLLPVYQSLVEIIESLDNEVASKHVVQEKTTKGAWQKDYTPDHLFRRELHRLQTCDVMVAEVTTPSWGTAFLLDACIQLRKPVLTLYYGTLMDEVPLMLRGYESLNLHLYTEDSARAILTDFFDGMKTGK